MSDHENEDEAIAEETWKRHEELQLQPEIVTAQDVVEAIDFQQARVAEIERRDQARLVVVKQGDGDGNLRRDIANILNHHCLENESDTPDFILANYLVECLKAFDRAVLARDAWYDEALYPGRQR